MKSTQSTVCWPFCATSRKVAPIASGTPIGRPLVKTTMPRSSPGMKLMKVEAPRSNAPE